MARYVCMVKIALVVCTETFKCSYIVYLGVFILFFVHLHYLMFALCQRQLFFFVCGLYFQLSIFLEF